MSKEYLKVRKYSKYRQLCQGDTGARLREYPVVKDETFINLALDYNMKYKVHIHSLHCPRCLIELPDGEERHIPHGEDSK